MELASIETSGIALQCFKDMYWQHERKLEVVGRSYVLAARAASSR